MKKVKYIVLFITIVCIFAMLLVNASASTEENYKHLTEKEGYLSSSEKSEIEQALSKAESNTGVSFRVYIYDYSDTYKRVDINEYERIAGRNFSDLVLLVISYEYGEFYYELFTKGSPDKSITDKEVNKILDNDEVYDNIKSGKIYEGIAAYIPLTEKAVSGTLRNSFISVLIPSIVISLIAAIGVVIAVVLKYRRKLHAASYPLDRYARLDLNVSTDDFVNKTVTRVRVNNSSGGKGRFGGGGGGSRGRR